MLAPLRVLLALGVLALVQMRGCGFTPVERKAEGEPCTRSTECEIGLECRGGVCMRAPDASESAMDASVEPDAAMDAALDAPNG